MLDTHARSSDPRSLYVPWLILQLDPNSRTDFTVYTFTVVLGTTTKSGGEVLSVRVAGGGTPAYAGGQEYWNITQDLIDAFAAGTTVTIAGTSANWSQGAPPGWQGSQSSPNTPSSVSWTAGDPASGSLYTSSVALKVTGSVTSPQVTWGILAASPPSTGTYAIHPSGGTLTSSAPSPGGAQWYKPAAS